MSDSPDWPLPSQSSRVRALLYLAEGTLLGAGLTLASIRILGPIFVDIETRSFGLTVSVFGAFLLFFTLFLLVRGIAAIDVGRRYGRDSPPEYRDWQETRRWTGVAVVALSVGVALLGVSVLLWNWWSVVFSAEAALLALGTVLASLFLYTYALHRIGV